MQITYGPPPASGVTSLMAVGADDYSASSADVAIHRGLIGAAAVAALGVLLNYKTARTAGLGALGALMLVRFASRQPTVVAVTK